MQYKTDAIIEEILHMKKESSSNFIGEIKEKMEFLEKRVHQLEEERAVDAQKISKLHLMIRTQTSCGCGWDWAGSDLFQDDGETKAIIKCQDCRRERVLNEI